MPDLTRKFTLRLPSSLHRMLKKRADDDGVSLQQWVIARLEEADEAAYNAELEAQGFIVPKIKSLEEVLRPDAAGLD
jgi:hypothetical protein